MKIKVVATFTYDEEDYEYMKTLPHKTILAVTKEDIWEFMELAEWEVIEEKTDDD